MKTVKTTVNFLIICLVSVSCVPLEQTGNTSTANTVLELADRTYDANIRMVRLFPSTGRSEDSMQPPIVHIEQESPLILLFDEILGDFQQYNAYIIHCNFDWEQSALADMEFLSEYNTLPVNDFQYSQNTVIPYTQYRLELPRVKKSGNYVVVVHRGTNRANVVLSRRFMVFEGSVDIETNVKISSSVQLREENHQVDFTVSYASVASANPYNDFKVVLQQNHRWDNAITDLKPTLIREDQGYLEYRHFTLQNNFKALREFRFFDTRSITFNGRNVAQIEKSDREVRAFLARDKSRFGEPYSRTPDLNGNYFVGSVEPNTSEMQTEYVKVMFLLEAEQLESGEVYVVGGFNDWNKTDENQLTFDEPSGLYTTSMLLKQGYYNYMYMVKGQNLDPYLFEGYNFQAENLYEVFVYFRAPGTFNDRLVGYRSVVHNGVLGN